MRNGYFREGLASFGTYTAVKSRAPSRMGMRYSYFVYLDRMNSARAFDASPSLVAAGAAAGAESGGGVGAAFSST
ncbi:hypothetical protein QHF89_43315 [Polyangium sorediatum]|uniref:Uncharacterized protein n=1 Tax=Polyangium sorediatum TaxID=889274 RepID=A0ABT6P724_9BACT|nr:hypothetical protein [Polyangium sorediatum]